MAKIVLDFDGTVFSTCRRMVDLVKIHYPNSYKGGIWKDVKKHGFSPVLDLCEDKLQDLFNRKDFYSEEYLMDGAIDTIKRLQAEGHTVEMLSVGTSYNNANKALLFERAGLEIALTLITTVGSNNVSFDKGTYTSNKKNGEISIYVDDRLQCLRTVKDFNYRIQMRECGYVLDSDKDGEFNFVTKWEDLSDKIENIIKYNE